MIEIKNVTKKYGNYVAVEDISFKVEESSMISDDFNFPFLLISRIRREL